MKIRIMVLLCALFLVVESYAAPVTQVIFPITEGEPAHRFEDLHEILQMALEKTVPQYGPFELTQSMFSMTESRYLYELRSGRSVNVVWSATSLEKERDLLPLRIPLRKGILGYRIAFIAKNKQDKIDSIKTLEDLRRFSVGQGIGWGDVQIYANSGIDVQTSNYELLFKMVSNGRFDLFPRGINEVFDEFKSFSANNPNLAIEQNLLLYYPWPYYFFFNKKDEALKQRVEAGIRIMLHDGSFDEIFHRYNDAAIKRARLAERRVIKLPNPSLPKETPLSDSSLWFDLSTHR